MDRRDRRQPLPEPGAHHLGPDAGRDDGDVGGVAGREAAVTFAEAWQRGEDKAKADMAEARPKLPDPLERGKAIMRDTAERAKAKRPTEPIVFCCVEACGLTCKPGLARCWVHEGAR